MLRNVMEIGLNDFKLCRCGLKGVDMLVIDL